MNKKIITTPQAPVPIGPYNQAVFADNILYVSGQICIDPQTGYLQNNNLSEETHQCMKNIQAILMAAGLDFSNIVKTSIFLTDMNHFDEINGVYGQYFELDYPARETIQVTALPKFVNIEISVIAVK